MSLTPHALTPILAVGIALAGTASGQSTPPGCVGSGIGIDLLPFVDGVPSTAPVAPGTEVFYQVALSQPLSFACSYHLGQLSVTLPDGQLVPVAGYEGTPDVPVTGFDEGPFTTMVSVPYVVDEADLNADGVLVAHADYGATINQPEQLDGTVLSSPPTPANSATIALPLQLAEPAECLLDVAVSGCLVPSSGSDACDGKVMSLTLTYTAEGCPATQHDQNPDKVECQDEAGLPATVLVRVSDDDDPTASNARIWFEGPVTAGESFVAAAANAGESQFPSATFVHVLDDMGVVLQFIEFHTSCSQPLAPGNQFGSIRIDGMTTTEGGHVGLDLGGECLTEVESDQPVTAIYTYAITNLGPDPVTSIAVIDDTFGPVPGSPIAELAPGATVELTLQTAVNDSITNTVLAESTDAAACTATASATVTVLPLPADCCADGDKPRVLFAQYTGDSCEATSHEQDPDKVECDDDGALLETVVIRATDKADPFDDGARIWFEGQVGLGETFALDAANAGQDKFSSATFVHILDGSSVVLQSVEFHTSCSQPLREGDQFGASRILGCLGQDDPMIDCDGNGIEDAIDLLQAEADCDGNGIIDACDPDQDGDGTPDACEFVCAGDVNGDLLVDVLDLVSVVLFWGTTDAESDLNDDGTVNVSDLTIVVLNWGPCPEG